MTNTQAQHSQQTDRMSTKEDVMRFLGLKSVRTVENLMRSGVLPYVKVGRLTRFSIQEVAEAMNQRCGKNRKGLR
jgi:excisionase family DNA binding protein